MNRAAWRRIERVMFAIAFPIVLVTVIALAQRFYLRFDWTVNRTNSLSTESARVLDAMRAPIQVVVAARPGSASSTYAADLLARYQARHRNLTVDFLDPRRRPQRARALGLEGNQILAIRYQGRLAHARELSEASLTRALYRVSRTSQSWIVSLVGHGERRLLGRANHDLGLFGRALQARGYKVREIDPSETGAIPDHTRALVLARPEVPLLPEVAQLVLDYLRRGGNLLWLTEPEAVDTLAFLREALALRFPRGTIVDPKKGALSRLSPTITLVTRYPPHPTTHTMGVAALFPGAAGVEAGAPQQQTEPGGGWTAEPIIQSPADSWLETKPQPGAMTFDPKADRKGPIAIALGLRRPAPHGEQRVAVFGDGDFLSNAYLGNQGNLNLGLRVMAWLVERDGVITIPATTAPDRGLALSGRGLQALALVAVIGLPLALVTAGIGIWLKRRRS